MKKAQSLAACRSEKEAKDEGGSMTHCSEHEIKCDLRKVLLKDWDPTVIQRWV